MIRFTTAAALALVLAVSGAALAPPAEAQMAERASKAAGEKAGAAYNAAMEAIKAGDCATAVSLLEGVLDGGGLPEDVVISGKLNRAICYLQLQNPAKAVEDFTAVIAARPQEAQAYAGRGQAHAQLNQTDLAIADLQQATVLAPEDASFYGTLCSVAFNARKLEIAAPACERFVAMSPAPDVQVMLATAQAWELLGDKAKSKVMYEKVLSAGGTAAEIKDAQDGLARLAGG
jgi:tetratricopeptide (TPR) repeat protein